MWPPRREPQSKCVSRSARTDASYSAALARGEFRAIFAVSVMTIAATVVSSVTLTVLVFERTRSPLLSAITFTLSFLPYLLAGTLVSGVLDRVPPRRLLSSCALGSAGLTAAMAIQQLPVAALLVMLLGTGTFGGIANAVQNTLVREVVPEATYVPARSLMRVAAQTAQICGNPLGGALVVAVSPHGAFLISSATLGAAAAVTRLGLQERPVTGGSESTRLLHDSLRGVRQVLAHAPLRRLLLLGWLVPMFAVAPEALAAPYVLDHGRSPALVGWWLAALPAGLILGDVLGIWCLSPERRRRVIPVAAAASFLPFLIFAVSPPVRVALPLLAAAGLGGMYSLGLDALVRDAAPKQLFARAMAVNGAALLTLQALGFTAAGAIAAVTGPGPAIAIAGICGIAAAVCLRPARRDASPRAKRAARLGSGPCTGRCEEPPPPSSEDHHQKVSG